MLNERKLTIDDLAEMTQNQFAKIDERFDRVDERFDAMQKHMDQQFSVLEKGQKLILEILVAVPSKKVIEKLVHRVQDIEERIAVTR